MAQATFRIWRGQGTTGAFVDYNTVTSPDQRVHEFALGIRLEHRVL